MSFTAANNSGYLHHQQIDSKEHIHNNKVMHTVVGNTELLIKAVRRHECKYTFIQSNLQK